MTSRDGEDRFPPTQYQNPSGFLLAKYLLDNLSIAKRKIKLSTLCWWYHSVLFGGSGTCSRNVTCPGLKSPKKNEPFWKKHRCPATHPEHDPPSVTIGHLVKTHFKHSLRSNNQPARKLQWLYATIARHSYLGTVEYHVLHWFMPVSEGQCEGYS